MSPDLANANKSYCYCGRWFVVARGSNRTAGEAAAANDLKINGVGGKMVNRPVADRHRQLMALAKAIEEEEALAGN